MQLHIVGAQNTGKTYLIDTFLSTYNNKNFPVPVYLQHLSYRDRVKSGKLKVNKLGTIESQREILDLIISDISQNTEGVSIVDRCPIDNLAYTLGMSLRDDFESSKQYEDILKETSEKISRFYSALSNSEKCIIAYLPICGCVDVPMVERPNREISDDTYRKKIDELMFDCIYSDEYCHNYDIRILVGTIDQKIRSLKKIILSSL